MITWDKNKVYMCLLKLRCYIQQMHLRNLIAKDKLANEKPTFPKIMKVLGQIEKVNIRGLTTKHCRGGIGSYYQNSNFFNLSYYPCVEGDCAVNIQPERAKFETYFSL